MYKKIFSYTVFFGTAFVMFIGVSFAQMHDHSQMQSMKDTNTSCKAKLTVFITPSEFKAQLNRVYKSYLSIQASLSNDEFQNARKNALILKKSLMEADIKLLTDMKAHMTWMVSSEKLAKDADHIAAAQDMQTARIEFNQASIDLIALAKQFGTSGSTTLYVIHCPMALKNKGADWVQDDTSVKNPYLGKVMLACGVITDTFGAK
jgi:membrane fusion protein, copper/silver efflux system